MNQANMPVEFSAEGRRVIITGAASGIGRAAARLFAQNGARVLASDQAEAGLASLQEEHGRSGDAGEILALTLDVSAEKAPGQLMATAAEQLGGLDVLVNNAGIGHRAAPTDTSDADWDRVNDVNLRAPFRICRAAIELLQQSQAGRIVNIASVMTNYADYGITSYCASKAGLAGMTRALALELGQYGITCNFIMPGAILTGMTQATLTQPDIAAVWERKSPLKRLGKPEDIAAGIYFLASPAAGFITGAGLEISGGLVLRT